MEIAIVCVCEGGGQGERERGGHTVVLLPIMPCANPT